MTKVEFKAEVKKRLVLRGWNYKELAEATGYTKGTVQVMMSDDEKLSSEAIGRISQVLGIKSKLLLKDKKGKE
jgi:plasmid maintenance system antidote protein VapI|nr:MAG TPA: SOS-response transcriptional repressor [Caudoviricetes sp.]